MKRDADYVFVWVWLAIALINTVLTFTQPQQHWTDVFLDILTPLLISILFLRICVLKVRNGR